MSRINYILEILRHLKYFMITQLTLTILLILIVLIDIPTLIEKSYIAISTALPETTTTTIDLPPSTYDILKLITL